MSESLQERWVQWAMGILIAGFAWLSVEHFSLEAKVQAMQLTQANIISPVVEASFREIRDKGNQESSGVASQLARLTQIATENSKDISFIKEKVDSFRPQK
jgi:hypothetical protein